LDKNVSRETLLSDWAAKSDNIGQCYGRSMSAGSSTPKTSNGTYRFCVAPMMDWTERSLESIDCQFPCAEIAHGRSTFLSFSFFRHERVERWIRFGCFTRERAHRGHLLLVWQRGRIIALDEDFLMNWQSANSLDGRYYGPLVVAEIDPSSGTA